MSTIRLPLVALKAAANDVTPRWRCVAAITGWVCLTAAGAAAQIPVTAAWDPNADSLTAGYRVFVGTSPGVPLTTLDVGVATRVVLPLPPGAVYYVAIGAYTSTGIEGPRSAEAVVDLATTPGAPTGVQASVSGANATLSWSPPTSGGVALRYIVSAGTSPGSSNLLSEYPVVGTTSVSGALPPGSYYARLQAGNLVGVGPPSAEVSFHVGGAAPPTPPTGLTHRWMGATVVLNWTPPAGGAQSYVIETGSVSGATDVGSLNLGATTTFSAEVPAGVNYYVRIRAINAAGMSAPSNQIVVRR